jgi:hypothetical protein
MRYVVGVRLKGRLRAHTLLHAIVWRVGRLFYLASDFEIKYIKMFVSLSTVFLLLILRQMRVQGLKKVDARFPCFLCVCAHNK